MHVGRGHSYSTHKTQEYLHEGDGGSDEGAGAIALPASWPRPEL